MRPGLYEQLITLGLEEALAATSLEGEREEVGEMAPHVLAHHLAEASVKALRNVPSEERATRQREVANKIVELLAAEVSIAPHWAMVISESSSSKGRSRGVAAMSSRRSSPCMRSVSRRSPPTRTTSS